MTYSHSMFVFVFPAHLPEGDGPAVPHLRLQTPCYHSSAALHQPGSHKGTRSRQFVCYCLCRSCFWLFMPSIGISPSLILFESGTRSLISHPVFFLVHFRWIRRSFSSVRLKHFQLFPQSFQIKTTVWSYTAVFFPKLPLRHSLYLAVLFNISSYLCVSLWFVRPQCPVRSLQDVTSGLVLCCLAVEYVSFSKRFLPELVNFLAGTLHLAVQDKTSLGTYTFHTSVTHVTGGSIWKVKPSR